MYVASPLAQHVSDWRWLVDTGMTPRTSKANNNLQPLYTEEEEDRPSLSLADGTIGEEGDGKHDES